MIDFDDPVGTVFSLVDDRGIVESFPWHGSLVPVEHRIRGLGYVMITVPELAPTHGFLTGAMGSEDTGSYPADNDQTGGNRTWDLLNGRRRSCG